MIMCPTRKLEKKLRKLQKKHYLADIIMFKSLPALWFEILHGCVCLVGGQDRHLMPIRSIGSGHDFILWQRSRNVSVL